MWYRYFSNLFDKIRKEANFDNIVTEILIKREERRVKWWDGGERKKNFDDVVAEIGGKKKKKIQWEKKMKNFNIRITEIHLPLAHRYYPAH